MKPYVDIFAIPIAKSKLDEYWILAEESAEIWTEHGATTYRETVFDEEGMPGMTSFVDLSKCGPDEELVISWVVYPSKADRDAANERIMSDPRTEALCEKCKAVFQGERMAFGGFQQVIARDRDHSLL